MTLGRGPLGRSPLGRGPLIIVFDAIDKTELMPVDAKIAIKDFIKESYNELWSHLNELIDIKPPTELIEYWNIFVQIIQNLPS
jgi:hypothetical protein